ncbi:MAG: glycosyltransferase family 4 protein [Syntrophorhabdaceae bacterium]|nr:glycosyltransferase family 4 protein [Syntrophorhabdaceae bacterium]
MKRKVCFAATLELSVKVFLMEHMRLLQDDFDLTVVVNTENALFLEPFHIKSTVIPVGIERKISPRKDLRSLVDLFGIFRREKFDILHSIMPKSGLLSMMAGLLARVPVRVHTFTGQVWKNSTGIERFVLKFMDKLLAACATHILVDSPSQREFLIRQGIVNRAKSSVIGRGSMCGVDMQRFHFDPETRTRIREMHDIPPDDIVFLFLGRLKKDKGILDLARAFSVLCGRFPNARLLIAGPDEEDLAEGIMAICAKCSGRVHITGFADAPEQYMSAADVLCLPSYREGFGLVIVEGAAVGIPSIGSRIYGITDAVEDGVSGFLFEPGAHHELMQKMARFVEDPSLIRTMGEKARLNVLEKYTKEKITSAMISYYRKLERSL